MVGAFDAFLHIPDTPPPTPSPTKRPSRPSPSVSVTKLKDHPFIRLEFSDATDTSQKRKRTSSTLDDEDVSVTKRRSARQAALASSSPLSTARSSPLVPSPPSSPEASHSISTSTTQPKQKKRKAARPYADPSTYAHLPQHLTDLIAPNLTLLLVGLNPGVMTAQTGFHFANPTNLFWPLLYSSNIITRPMRASESTCLISEFNIGITNIVKRPTAEGGELSKEECVAGAADLIQLVKRVKPKAIALTGKGIWDAMFRHLHARPLRKSDNFAFGWQVETIALDHHDVDYCGGGRHCRVFVTMGTSGRVAAYSPAYKREVFNELGKWVNEERVREVNGNAALATDGRVKVESEVESLGREIEEEEEQVKMEPAVQLYDDEKSPFF